MLIEILGSSGAGKTTIKKMLLDRLRHHGLQARDAEISANGTSCSKFKIVLVELLRNPWLLPMAFHLASLKQGKHGIIHWLRCFIRNVYTCRKVRLKGGIYLIDQDVISSLSRTPGVPKSLMKRIPLPDLAVEIRVDKATRAKRTITCEERNTRPMRGEQRLTKGKQIAALLYRSYPEEMPNLMQRWNERFCYPNLDSEQLERLIQEVVSKEKGAEYTAWPASTDGSQLQGVLWWALKNGKLTIHHSDEDALLIRQQLQQRGLQWWTVDNGRQANLSDVVESLVERISKEVHHPSRVQSNGDKVLS